MLNRDENAKEFWKTILNNQHMSDSMQQNYMSIHYREVSGLVSKHTVYSGETDLEEFSFLECQHVFTFFEILRKERYNIPSELKESHFPDMKEPFEALSLTIGTDLQKTFNSPKKKLETIFVFGEPMYKDFLQNKIDFHFEKYLQQNKNEADKLKKLFQYKMIIKKLQGFQSDIIIKSCPQDIDDWNINKLDIYGVPSPVDENVYFRNIKFIHPTNNAKVWQSGVWTDIEWDDLGGIKNGDTKNIPNFE